MQIALYQPDIPQNTGTILRMCACFNIPAHIIEPAGFDMSDRNLKRAGLDYLDSLDLTRHVSFDVFLRNKPEGRLLLATTKGATQYTAHNYSADDILLMGRESSGVPENVHDVVDESIYIPMEENMRSLNIALACAMITGEILRQVNYSGSE